MKLFLTPSQVNSKLKSSIYMNLDCLVILLTMSEGLRKKRKNENICKSSMQKIFIKQPRKYDIVRGNTG